MSRTFWVAVGAVGGVVAYRKGTRTVVRARELGPLGSAKVAAQATSRLAGRTAHGLGRLQDAKARKEGRLLTGTAHEVAVGPPTGEPPTVSTVLMESPAVGIPVPGANPPGRRTATGVGA